MTRFILDLELKVYVLQEEYKKTCYDTFTALSVVLILANLCWETKKYGRFAHQLVYSDAMKCDAPKI